MINILKTCDWIMSKTDLITHDIRSEAYLDLKKITHFLVLVSIAITPLFSTQEILALLKGTIQSQIEVLTPVYVKAIKDLSFLTIVFVGIVATLIRGRVSKSVFFFAAISVYIILIFCISFYEHKLLALSGIRWIFPFFLIFFFIEHSDHQLMKRIARILIMLFFLHVALQGYQLINMSYWFGKNFLGLPGRVPGIFFIPNSAAFYVALTLFFAHFYEDNGKLKVAAWVFAPVSIFLTMSGTGVVVCLVFVAMILVGQRYICVFVPLSPIVAIPIIPIMLSLVNRGPDYIERSLGKRLEIVINLLLDANWIPQSFGFGSNTGVILAEKLGIETTAKVVDSSYASIIANLGLFGLVIFVVVLMLWVVIIFKLNKLELYVFTMIFMLFGATTIVTEVFPANLLFAVTLGYYIKRYVRLGQPRKALCQHGAE